MVRGSLHHPEIRVNDRHPHAGGPGHHTAYLEDVEGFEIELVADDA